jgi:hypothetical protein
MATAVAILATILVARYGAGLSAIDAGQGAGAGGARALPDVIAGARPALDRTVPRHADPAPVRVSGRSVTAIGDSVLVASTPALQQALPGIAINAMVGRQFSTGLQVLADIKAQGELRPILVFALGTNGTVTAAELETLFAAIGPHRRLVLVNTFEARPWEQEVNAALAAAARSHARVVLANWFGIIEHRTNLLWPDGIHPQPAGGVLYARMLTRAVDKVAALAA